MDRGVSAPFLFFADKLTLFQPGGQIMPTTLLLKYLPPRFFDSAASLNYTFRLKYFARGKVR